MSPAYRCVKGRPAPIYTTVALRYSLTNIGRFSVTKYSVSKIHRFQNKSNEPSRSPSKNIVAWGYTFSKEVFFSFFCREAINEASFSAT
jgi:hypothetical protein